MMPVLSGSPDWPAAAAPATKPPPPSPGRDSASPFGPLALLSFFFYRRITRSGPKLLLYLSVLLASLLLVTRCLPNGLSDSIVSSTSHLWTFRPGGRGRGGSKRPAGPPGANNADDALAGGGLRVVAFGENDVATSVPHNGTSWTQELCLELGCTTYLSYVPALDGPPRSLSSNPLYDAATEQVRKDGAGQTPANDFSYVAAAYPSSRAADLAAQVDQFLQQPAPARPPKETVWVLSFGMWDVWSLAAFPYGEAESLLGALVADLFAHVERLYAAAHDPGSVAYSDFSIEPVQPRPADLAAAARNETEAEGQRKTTKTTLAARGSKTAKLPWDDAGAAPFRVLIPLLFDPSLLPAWHLDRPAAPPLHTQPEQLRSVVRLTNRWNERVLEEMDAWAKKNASAAHPDESAEAAEGNTWMAELPHRSAKTRRAAAAAGRDRLQRDGVVFRPADYVMDAIIDGQMQARGVADRRGFGKFARAESFDEVDKPCLAPAAALGKQTGDSTDSKDSKDSKRAAFPSPPAVATAVSSPSSSSSSSLQVCDHPDQHLFFTPYSLGQRAIGEVGRLSAAMVRANRSMRATWEEARRTGIESGRMPGAWKEYYLGS